MNGSLAQETGPLTTVVTWRVRQGSEREFEAWRHEISVAALTWAAMPLLVKLLRPWLKHRP